MGCSIEKLGSCDTEPHMNGPMNGPVNGPMNGLTGPLHTLYTLTIQLQAFPIYACTYPLTIVSIQKCGGGRRFDEIRRQERRGRRR